MGHHKEHAARHEADYKLGRKDESIQQSAEKVRHTAPSSSEPESDEELDGIQAQQERLMKTLKELKLAGTDAWAELRTGAENAFEELKGSVGKAIGRFETALHRDENHGK